MFKTTVAVLLCLTFLSCTTFKPVAAAPADIRSFQPLAAKKYRIITNDGETIETKGSNIKIVDDNIYVDRDRSLSMNNISNIRVKKINKGLIIAGSVIGAIVIGIAIGGAVAWSNSVSGDDK